VQDLVVTSLQECRIDSDDWNIALRRHTSRKRHGVLFGDADVVGAIRNFSGELVDTRAAAHRRGHPDDFRVLFGQPDK
jgi:hypothetical protein